MTVEAEGIWDAELAQSYDTPGAAMFAPELLQATADRLVELAGDGDVLEFAIGTGRVAVPLAERGIRVSGLDSSQAMIDELRKKVDEGTIPVVLGDMATARVPGEYSLVYLVFNTISNLLTQSAQVECFRNAARHLGPGGRFLIELWVPYLRGGDEAVVWSNKADYIGLDTFDILHQRVVSHHFTLTGGREARLVRTPHRYVWPSELDLMAKLAGFNLESRHADWNGSEFVAGSPSHVSVYRLGEG